MSTVYQRLAAAEKRAARAEAMVERQADALECARAALESNLTFLRALFGDDSPKHIDQDWVDDLTNRMAHAVSEIRNV